MARNTSTNDAAAAYQRMVSAYGVATPYRIKDESIARERERFDRAQVLIKEGRLDEARRIVWWPRNESPPREHWSRKPVAPCFCGKRSPDGIYALCGYCGGRTAATPSLIAHGPS